MKLKLFSLWRFGGLLPAGVCFLELYGLSSRFCMHWLNNCRNCFFLEWHQASEAICWDGELATRLHGLYCDTNTVSSQTMTANSGSQGFLTLNCCYNSFLREIELLCKYCNIKLRCFILGFTWKKKRQYNSAGVVSIYCIMLCNFKDFFSSMHSWSCQVKLWQQRCGDYFLEWLNLNQLFLFKTCRFSLSSCRSWRNNKIAKITDNHNTGKFIYKKQICVERCFQNGVNLFHFL